MIQLTSTVGFPLESRISRALIALIVDILRDVDVWETPKAADLSGVPVKADAEPPNSKNIY